MKDLTGAFAQLPHLPKMLKAQAIVETLVGGCAQGTFVLKLMRPDRTFRTWWRSQPDEAALGDPALELVLPEAAELGEIAADLLAPKALPSLWAGNEIVAQAVLDYFGGRTVVQVDKGGYQEPASIPKASADVVNVAIGEAVAAGKVWLLSGPASLLAEPIPAGVLVLVPAIAFDADEHALASMPATLATTIIEQPPCQFNTFSAHQDHFVALHLSPDTENAAFLTRQGRFARTNCRRWVRTCSKRRLPHCGRPRSRTPNASQR